MYALRLIMDYAVKIDNRVNIFVKIYKLICKTQDTAV